QAVVGQPAQELLLARAGGRALEGVVRVLAAEGRDAIAVLAADVPGERESGAREAAPRARNVEVPDLDAVVAVEAHSARTVLGIPADIVVRDERDPLERAVEKLHAQAWHFVELAVGLPAVDDPRLDLELVA